MWDIVLTRHREQSLSRQLFFQIKDLILEGKLNAGELLPSSRFLAKELGISRSTVTEAYDMLQAEGFVAGRQGARLNVLEGLSLHQGSAKRLGLEKGKERCEPTRPFWIDFKTGQPDVHQFPHSRWRQLLTRACDRLREEDMGYSDPAGYEPLRNEICEWLFRTRGINAVPQDLFLTAGTTHALSILVDLLASKELPIAVEDPCHSAVIEIVKSRGFPYTAIPVDEHGLQTAFLAAHPFAALSAVYVTPSHQFPLGGIFPAERRAQLVRRARSKGFYILEDDYDSEFRYEGAPITPMYSMDRERVLYMGSFSKTLFPALRIGFVLLPPELHGPWLHGRRYLDVQNSILEQAALAEFLHTRKLDAYIRQSNKRYADKRRVLCESISHYFGSRAVFHGDRSGLHLVLQIPGMAFGEEFLANCKEKGVRVEPVERYCQEKGRHPDKLLMGYGHLSLEEIPIQVESFYHFLSEVDRGIR
ncbi:PLP-dependent aminotransferase family protein [Gorillibacterium sp. CAU 1737]|uniref:MocR-like pyridoxine biosynthesis transcription factor PdxR n=1 Tax=Gorillibacterium sp. CAU 1737 TaxID=3140362 RepID=UPI00326132C6